MSDYKKIVASNGLCVGYYVSCHEIYDDMKYVTWLRVSPSEKEHTSGAKTTMFGGNKPPRVSEYLLEKGITVGELEILGLPIVVSPLGLRVNH